MKKAIIIIISLLVILGGVGAVLWFFTPLFDFLKPARDNFAAQVKKLYGAKTEMSYDDYLKSIEPLKAEQKSFVSKTNVSANITVPSSVIDYTTQRQINNTTINMENSYDAGSKAVSTKINWKYQTGDILNLKMVKDGKKITLSSKDFYDKAVTLDVSKIREYCKNNNINISEEELKNIEKSFESYDGDKMSAMIYDLLYLTEDEYKALQKNYGSILEKYIDKKNYTTEKSKKISVDGNEIKATGYSLTISGEDVYNLIKDLANDAKNDDNLKSIIVNKINLLKNNIGEIAKSGASQADLEEIEEVLGKDVQTSDVEKVFDQFLDALEQTEESFKSLKKSVKITIYADKKSNPVRMDVAIVKNADDDGYVVFSEEVGSKKNTYTIDVQNIMKVVADVSGSENASSSIPLDKVVIVDEIEKKSDTERKGTLKVSVKANGQKAEIAQVDYELVTSDSEVKRNFKVTSSLASVDIDVKCEATGLDTDNQSMVLDVNASVQSYKVNVKVDSSIEYGRADIETYNDTNSVDLFSKSKEETNQIITDIVTKMSDVLPARLANYGIKVTKQEIMELAPKTAAPATTDPNAPVDPNAAPTTTPTDATAVQPAA